MSCKNIPHEVNAYVALNDRFHLSPEQVRGMNMRDVSMFLTVIEVERQIAEDDSRCQMKQ
jgi:hypothetical protein